MEDQDPEAAGLLIQEKNKLVVVLMGRFPQETGEISERLQYSWSYSHRPPQHRISPEEGTPERSTARWQNLSILGKLSHLATSGSG